MLKPSSACDTWKEGKEEAIESLEALCAMNWVKKGQAMVISSESPVVIKQMQDFNFEARLEKEEAEDAELPLGLFWSGYYGRYAIGHTSLG